MNYPSKITALVAALGIWHGSAGQVAAVEGGIETYLLGSRDSMAGVLPPPGTYWNNDFVFFSGSAPAFSVGDIVVTDPDIDVFTYKSQFGTPNFWMRINSYRFV
ncbi:MAG: hypothetical protein ACU0BB_11135 [Paracoccaceae bacterium]